MTKDNLIDKFLHVRSLEKYHPGYQDRKLRWAKIYFDMVQGDPDCEMITDETDFARLIKFIILELQAQKPIPLNETYLTKKGFNLKKRPMSLTINMLQNFVEVVTQENILCGLDKEEDKEKDKEEDSVTAVKNQWNEFAKANGLTQVMNIIGKRKQQFNSRLKEDGFDFSKILICASESEFLLGKNDRGWKMDFDFIVKNNTNFLKILEGKYKTNSANKTKSGKDWLDML